MVPTTVFLLVMFNGVVQFMLPMKYVEACHIKGVFLGQMMKPHPALQIGCFDVMTQMFVRPSQPSMQMMPPFAPHMVPPHSNPSEGPSPDRQAQTPLPLPQGDEERVD